MQMPGTLATTDLAGLELVNRGKVRDIYAVDDRLLIVATDRISCFDVVLRTAIPWKGKVLTHLTRFWLDRLADLAPNHLVTTDVRKMGPAIAPHARQLRGRSMLVKRAEVLPIECVVRGYLSGSGWRSYREGDAICGIALPAGLRESDRLPEPIFTPTTKEASGHDLPLTMAGVESRVGAELACRLRDLSIGVYLAAAEYAAGRGIIISDTKFEWGFVGGELTLVDEVLTPDSSRSWPADLYEPGRAQASYDKQYVRDWLDESGWDHEPPSPELPADVVRKTAEKYLEACRLLTGRMPAA
jgi:phosphoribosylaminoimidazole-succinocarboxamide synthase